MYCVVDTQCPGPSYRTSDRQWLCTVCAQSVYTDGFPPSKPVQKTLDSITEYSGLANRTLADNVRDSSVVPTWPKNAAMALNGVLGLSSESGEINEIIKKWLFHGHPMDEATLIHLQKELGDLAWYFALCCFAFDMAPAGVLATNIAKLKARYPQGFSTERSMNRKPGDI
jgi:NTP pyrophosphatase (non-canonical NTP hydrolase)